MKIFSAKNLSLANYLIANGCPALEVKKNPSFGTMVLIDFAYDENLCKALTTWTNNKKIEREAKGINDNSKEK